MTLCTTTCGETFIKRRNQVVAGSNPVRLIIKRGCMKERVKNEKMDISVDITAHILVPKHSKLTVEETNALLDKLNISINQLPKILKSDPAIRQINAEVGDIIIIERESPTSGKANYYRVVING